MGELNIDCSPYTDYATATLQVQPYVQRYNENPSHCRKCSTGVLGNDRERKVVVLQKVRSPEHLVDVSFSMLGKGYN